ncbi:hypothetical protein [Noviluteimonas gilva]|uniref:Lipoprotein n=1 Tax=Noviluteimonas gilva TaxID=2682097 RepID=A0A7C9LLU8_9GAMM|nr:hypothetical protein [Lysobacter gilvus]MUV14544.1 hypothetical protein [Lysobacter gilvus]
MKYRFVAPILLAFVAGRAQACVDPELPSYRQELSSARHVFVFRLLSLRLINRAEGAREVVGEIETVRVLKGQPRFTTVAWEQGNCGQLVLRVGGYYAAATKQSGTVLKPVRGQNSMLDVGDDFAYSVPHKRPGQTWIFHVANYLRDGTPFPEYFNVDQQMTRTGSFPQLPPPRKR